MILLQVKASSPKEAFNLLLRALLIFLVSFLCSCSSSTKIELFPLSTKSKARALFEQAKVESQELREILSERGAPEAIHLTDNEDDFARFSLYYPKSESKLVVQLFREDGATDWLIGSFIQMEYREYREILDRQAGFLP